MKVVNVENEELEISKLGQKVTSRFLEVGYRILGPDPSDTTIYLEREFQNHKYRGKNLIGVYVTEGLESISIDSEIMDADENGEPFHKKSSKGFQRVYPTLY